MQKIKLIGLLLFVAGFLLFNFLFFASSYRITEAIIDDKISDAAKASLFEEASTGLLDVEVPSAFAFVKQLHATFDRVNARQISTYAFTEADVDKLTSLNQNKFSLATIDSAFAGAGDVFEFKRKSFRDYAGWLEGQTASRDQLASVAENIKKYGIVNQFGFDRYAIKELSYTLTKSATTGIVVANTALLFLLTFGLCVTGALLYILPKLTLAPGIKNNGIFFSAMKNTGWLGVVTGSWLIAFYILLYFYPEYMTSWVLLVDPVSRALSGIEAGRFFLYGFLYTLCVLVMGIRMLFHYRHSKYQVWRTGSVMFFQTAFAFLIPEILVRLNQPYFDFKNIWPLDYSFFFDYRINQMVSNGTFGLFMLGWGIMLIVVGVPVLVYFFGKRWYCSWVCGCGGLAETLGDPYRQLSNKSLKAWQLERWLIHAVLVFAVVMTGGVLYTYFTGSSYVFFFDSYKVREWYGAFIGAGFAGVVGTGFYPLMGNRVWCRFGCPLAAYLGLVQRFKSRFRITTNGGQCISCGNCSTYCEMGIDVRWYAQRGQNIIRSSCVGCGICSAVCPRGVLNLEVKDEQGRFGRAVLLGNDGVVMPEIKK
jgi:Pyruvate/2-oxoacid:ferredoxin oxidoreductase delta subunit